MNAEAEIAALRRRLDRERRARIDAEAIAGRGLNEAFQRGRALELLRQVATAANAGGSPEQVVEAALGGLCDHGGWTSGHAWRVMAGQPFQGIGSLVLGPMPEDRRATAEAPAPSALAVRAAAQARPLLDADCANGPAAACAVPVMAGDAVAAVMELRRPDAVATAPGFLDLAAQVAAQVSRALERTRAEERLRQAMVRLDVAIGSMSQGLCLFDPERRLVLANRRYADLHALDLPEALPFDAFLAAHAGRFETRSADRAMAALLDEALAEGEASGRLTLADGRIVALRAARTPDGGAVMTHQDITRQHAAEARIAHLAHHDGLTGLPNRARLRERLAQELATVRRYGGAAAMLCFDLDRFKAVNDTLGHAAGDALLQQVAARMQGAVREADMAARLGGDEFAILQTGDAQPAAAIALASRLIDELSQPFDLDGHQVQIGTSVGIALAPTDGHDAEALLKNADLALYRSKAEGRGTYRFFEAGMDERMRARRALELDLRRALAAGEFEVHYQPTVNLRSRAIAGFEALLRWRHPMRGLVSPADFIPLAEEIGLIIPLGEFVLRRACADAATWPDDVKVAVNLSPVQFVGAGPLPAVTRALADSGLPAHRLEIEITETAMLADTDAVLATLRELKALGVGIAMDDFGTGYSSLSYLRKFPFDRVKIDRSFIAALDEPSGGAIVQAVTALCQTLGMETTAEGVENPAQLAALDGGGCTDAQGFLFSQARPADEIPMLLDRLAGRQRAA